jgi:nucleotide-binding universal stress UspA family protein
VLAPGIERQRREPRESAMSRILLPIDDSSKLEHALRHAARCQRESHSPIQIHVLHVETPLSSYVASKLPAGATRRYHDDRSREVLEPVAAALARANIPHRIHTAVGDPVTCIVEFAAETHVDRIVMVTRARPTIPEVLLGSVTAGVLQHAPVPVEVVPIDPGSPVRVYARAAGAGAAILTLVYLALE